MSVRKCPFVLDLSFCPEDFVPTFFGVSRSSATASLASGALYVFFLGTSGWWSSYTWVLAVVITMCMLPSSRDVVSCGGRKGTESAGAEFEARWVVLVGSGSGCPMLSLSPSLAGDSSSAWDRFRSVLSGNGNYASGL